MNALDVLTIVLAVGAAVAGWRLGFVRRVTGWAGMIGGVALALWLLPKVRAATHPSSTPARFLVGAAVLVVGAVVGQALGAIAGSRIHAALGSAREHPADSAFGALSGVVGLVVVLWVVLPSMADVSGWPARQARTSTVARSIDRVLGRPPGILDGLSRSLGLAGLPRVFDSLQTAPKVKAPPGASPVPAAVLTHVEASTVKVVGPACDVIQSGTGWVVRPGLVVTNAHVVAGTRSVRLESQSGSHAGTVVAFDPRHDLALISSPGLKAQALPTSTAVAGDVGVDLGYPGGGDLTISPYRISQRVQANGRDIYDQAAVTRDIFVIGANLHPGDSGGPLVDPAGDVVGVAFAIAPDQSAVAYAITIDQVQTILAGPHTKPTSVGPCTNG
jgi:S1-C subfamily serine protease